MNVLNIIKRKISRANVLLGIAALVIFAAVGFYVQAEIDIPSGGGGEDWSWESDPGPPPIPVATVNWVNSGTDGPFNCQSVVVMANGKTIGDNLPCKGSYTWQPQNTDPIRYEIRYRTSTQAVCSPSDPTCGYREVYDSLCRAPNICKRSPGGGGDSLDLITITYPDGKGPVVPEGFSAPTADSKWQVPNKPMRLIVDSNCSDFHTTRLVCANGSYRTIQAAIEDAFSGSTIVVPSGVHKEFLHIKKPIVLEGAGHETTILERPASVARTAIIEITGTGTSGPAVVRGLRITGGFAPLTAAIYVHNDAMAEISRNVIKGTEDGGTAILVGVSGEKPSEVVISNNEISGFGPRGIRVQYDGNKANIFGNTITGAGPSLITTTGNNISGVQFIPNGQTGVDVEFNAYANVSNNTFSNFGYKTQQGNVPARARCVSFVNINNPADPDWYNIRGNSFTDCQAGVWIYGNRGLTGEVTHNTFRHTGVFESAVAYLASSAMFLLRGGNLVVEHNIFFADHNWATIGFWYHGSQASWSPPYNSKAIVRNNSFTGFLDAIRLDNVHNTPTISSNSFVASGRAIRLCYGSTLDIRSNWWGNDSGPSHESNSGGTGTLLYNALGSCGGTGTGKFIIGPWLKAPPDTEGPDAPTLTSAEVVSASQIKLSWGAVTGAHEYRVYRNGKYIASTKQTSHQDTDLFPGTYSYTVAAFDQAGNSSKEASFEDVSLKKITLDGAAQPYISLGSPVVLLGSGIEMGSAVNINGIPITFSQVSDDGSSLTFKLPDNFEPGTYNVSVSKGPIKSNEISLVIIKPGALRVASGPQLPRAFTVPAGATNVPLGSVSISAQNESITLDHLGFRFTAKNMSTIQKFVMWDGAERIAEGPPGEYVTIPIRNISVPRGASQVFTVTVDVASDAVEDSLTVRYEPKVTRGTGQQTRILATADGAGGRMGGTLRISASTTPSLSIYSPLLVKPPGSTVSYFLIAKNFARTELRFICDDGISTRDKNLCGVDQAMDSDGIISARFDNSAGGQKTVYARYRGFDAENNVTAQRTIPVRITASPLTATNTRSVTSTVAGIFLGVQAMYSDFTYYIRDIFFW